MPKMPAGRVILAISAATAITLSGWAGYNRAAFGSFSPPPARVDYCGRRYYPTPPPGHVNLAQIRERLAQTRVGGPFQQIGVDGWGQPYFARVYDDAKKREFYNQLCTFDVFVRVGPDDYISYGLSGGP